jgi:hypothetical protein
LQYLRGKLPNEGNQRKLQESDFRLHQVHQLPVLPRALPAKCGLSGKKLVSQKVCALKNRDRTVFCLYDKTILLLCRGVLQYAPTFIYRYYYSVEDYFWQNLKDWIPACLAARPLAFAGMTMKYRFSS